MKVNTLGREQTAIGYLALTKYTTNGAGVQDGLNTAVGSQSFLNLVTGNSNVGLGQKSGTNALGAGNTFLGTKSGSSFTTGNSNVIIGEQAGSTGLADITGDYNVAVGQGAMATLGAKNKNTVGGRNAFRLLGVADENTGWGYAVGENCSTGTRNSYFGNLAGNAATTANDITAFGWKALQVNTTGENSAFGSGSQTATTTGTANNSFGYLSLSLNADGGQNCAFGNSALKSNVSGIRNTAVGNLALEDCTAAAGQNSAFGYGAGANVTSGEGNTFLGFGTGRIITTGSYNVFLGPATGDTDSSWPNSTSNTFACGHPSLPINTAFFGSAYVSGAAAPTNGTSLSMGTVNAASVNLKSVSENITIAAAATSTSAANLIPANAFVVGVVGRVTVVIPTAATFDVGVTGTPAKFGDDVLVAAGTTFSSFKLATPLAPFMQTAATTILITPNANPADNTGRVRVTVYYYDLTEPGS